MLDEGQDFGEKMAKVRTAAKSFGEDKDCTFEAKVRRLSLSLPLGTAFAQVVH